LAFCSTPKEELTQRLVAVEHRLESAIIDASNHGQNYHKSVYQSLLTQVQDSIKGLKDNMSADELSNETNQIVALEIQVFSKLRSVDLHEIGKTKAIYLAAMKQVTGYNLQFPAGQHLRDVVKIVEMEGYMRENPTRTVDPNMRQNTLKYSLELEYANLLRTMQNWTVGDFDDYYNLANRTRAKIVQYRQRSMALEANKAESLLADFDPITLAMAQEWPIDSIQSVEYYFSLAKLHRSWTPHVLDQTNNRGAHFAGI